MGTEQYNLCTLLHSRQVLPVWPAPGEKQSATPATTDMTDMATDSTAWDLVSEFTVAVATTNTLDTMAIILMPLKRPCAVKVMKMVTCQRATRTRSVTSTPLSRAWAVLSTTATLATPHTADNSTKPLQRKYSTDTSDTSDTTDTLSLEHDPL